MDTESNDNVDASNDILGTRSYLFVCCDGSPYTALLKLKQQRNICTECQTAIDSCSASEHDGFRVSEFDWVIPIIGVGHEEKTMLSCFATVAWNVFYKELAYSLGFCSENAQNVLLKATDHHKAYQAFVVGVNGLAIELVRPYVYHCRGTERTPTPNGLIQHIREAGPCARLLYELVFLYGVAIMALRAGTRTESPKLLVAGRQAFAPLFFMGRHPHYQKIEANGAALRHMLPSEAVENADALSSFRASCQSRSAEAVDYHVEMLNKRIKSHFYSGVPGSEQWLLAHRVAAETPDLRNAYSKLSDSTVFDNRTGARINLDAELAAWRAVCRRQLAGPIASADSDAHRLEGAAAFSGYKGFSREPLRQSCTAAFETAVRRYTDAVHSVMLQREFPVYRPLSLSISDEPERSATQLRQFIMRLSRGVDLSGEIDLGALATASVDQLEIMALIAESFVAMIPNDSVSLRANGLCCLPVNT
jgi:hypothetical protein